MDQYFVIENKTRYDLPDSVRGICILGMVVYHTLFDVFALQGIEMTGGWFTVLDIIRDIGAAAFIFISGMCIHFGRHPLRRFFILICCGTAVHIITRFVMPYAAVTFGILTFMGVSGRLLCLLKKPLCSISPTIGFGASVVMFLLFSHVNYGYIGLGNLAIFTLPRFLYQNYVTAFFGFPFEGFSSGDYYPLLPWIWICFAGFYFYLFIKNHKNLMKYLYFRIPVFNIIGKYSLPIYLLHQPLIFGILLLFLRFET